MKNFSYVLAMLFATCAPIYAQTDVTGTWRAEGAGTSWEVVLRVDGPRLTGMVSSCTSIAVDIYDGHIDGNTITFTCKSPSRDRRIAFTGTISGDDISFTWKLQNPAGVVPANQRFFVTAPPRFTAKRVPDSELAELADQVRGVEFAAAVNLLQKDVKVDGTLLVPENVRRVRAVIVATYWGLGQNFYNDPQVRKFLEATESGLLLARFSNMGPSPQQYRNMFNVDGADALVLLLQRLAQESGHQELTDAPLLFWGHSAGSGAFFAEGLPQRTVALVLYHSGLVIKPGGGADLKVRSQIPALFFAGGKDTAVLANPMQELWKLGRSVGAPWTFAIEPDATHGDPKDLKKANDLVIPWISAVLRQRLSTDGTTLRAVTDASAWMGNNQTGEAAPYGAFRESRPEASWLPDEASARGWRIVLGAAK